MQTGTRAPPRLGLGARPVLIEEITPRAHPTAPQLAWVTCIPIAYQTGQLTQHKRELFTRGDRWVSVELIGLGCHVRFQHSLSF